MSNGARTVRPDVHIRRATTSDAALLSELGARLFEQTFGTANDPENMRLYLAATFSVERQSTELADVDRAAWIAEDATGAPVGYTIWLGVWENNAPAIALYRRLGFRPVGMHTFTLGNDPQHDVVMSMSIS